MVLSTKACGHNAVVAVDAGEEDAGGPLPLCRVGMMVCPPNNAHADGHESCLAPFSPPQLHAHCSAGR